MSLVATDTLENKQFIIKVWMTHPELWAWGESYTWRQTRGAVESTQEDQEGWPGTRGAWQLLRSLPPVWPCSVRGGARGSEGAASSAGAGAPHWQRGRCPAIFALIAMRPEMATALMRKWCSKPPPPAPKLTVSVKYFWWHRTLWQVLFFFFKSYFQCTRALSN